MEVGWGIAGACGLVNQGIRSKQRHGVPLLISVVSDTPPHGLL